MYRIGPQVYLAGPMLGHTVGEAMHWRLRLRDKLLDAGMGYSMPHDATDWFVYPEDYVLKGEELANVADIWQWDKLIVESADAVLVDFRYARRVSIGTVQEIAWAVCRGVPVVLLMPKAGVKEETHESWYRDLHRHPFLLDQALAVFEDEDEAVTFLHDYFKVGMGLKPVWKTEEVTEVEVDECELE